MKIAQTIVIAWWLAKLALHILNHDEPLKRPMLKYNMFSTILDIIISASILYWGGFFDCLF